ncbi:MAG: hypothetical protein Greene07144_693 [Parcubacteria group bacterium Greene0714_4]|nr:MAG: hypothetical protein Greene101415_75 [Parcubacteria group bacterium Greene1014_15]TSD07821.1 MAG: hypothetical protein Greene07144_693 [Parcubacteria group bacterium Greene0714_4]
MPNYEPWNISHEMFDGLTTQEQKLRFLVRYAVLAPSSHNSQPWSFVASGSHIDLIPDLSRALEISDIDHRQLHISMGTALENLLIAAEYFGYATHVSYLLGRVAGTEQIRIEFAEQTTEVAQNDRRLVEAILRRHTNRGEYTKEIPEASFLEEIRKLTTDAIRIDIVTNPVKKQALADVTIRAGIAAMDDPKFRAELSRYLKNNQTRSPLGMPAFGMGIPTLLSFIVPFLSQFFNINKLREKADRALLTEHTPAILVISTAHDTPEYWIKTGKIYERIALEATAHGMHTNPMAAAIQIGDFYMELQKILGIKSTRPQFFSRLGYAKSETRHSPRLHADHVTASASSESV